MREKKQKKKGREKKKSTSGARSLWASPDDNKRRARVELQ